MERHSDGAQMIRTNDQSNSEAPPDPVVAEVRAIRRALWDEAKHSLDALFDLVAKEGGAASSPALPRPGRRKTHGHEQ